MKKLYLIALILFASVVSLNAESWIKFNTGNCDIPSNYIYEIMTTAEGFVYITTDAGLAVYYSNDWTIYNYEESPLPSNDPTALAMNSQGDLYIGTFDDGLVAKLGHSWAKYNMTNSDLPDNTIFAMEFDGQDVLWICTSMGGLVKFDGENWLAYTSLQGLPEADMMDVAIDLDGNKWVATSDGLAKVTASNTVVYKTSNSDLPDDYVIEVEIAPDNSVWVGTMNGLAHIDGDTWTVYSDDEFPLEDTWVTALEVVNDGTVYAGTSADGVVSFDGSEWTSYHTSNSDIPGNSISFLAFDGHNIWVGTENSGLAKMDPTGSAVEEETEKVSISISPNPITENSVVNVDVPAGRHSLCIMDMTGRKVADLPNSPQFRSGYYSVPIGNINLPNGMYMLVLNNEADIISLPFVICK